MQDSVAERRYVAPTLNESFISGDNAIETLYTATYPFNQSRQAHGWAEMAGRYILHGGALPARSSSLA